MIVTKRERNQNRLNEERLKEVFAVLVANCGAPQEDEQRFLVDFSYNLERYAGAASCWGFDGYIGGNGGFYFSEDGIPALCCSFGVLDQEIRSMLFGVHNLFLAMRARWMKEDAKVRARERRDATRAAKQAEQEARRLAAAPRKRLSLLGS